MSLQKLQLASRFLLDTGDDLHVRQMHSIEMLCKCKETFGSSFWCCFHTNIAGVTIVMAWVHSLYNSLIYIFCNCFTRQYEWARTLFLHALVIYSTDDPFAQR